VVVDTFVRTQNGETLPRRGGLISTLSAFGEFLKWKQEQDEAGVIDVFNKEEI